MSDAARPEFPPTRWTLILDLRGADRQAAGRALEELCRLYWYPVYAFIRRQGAGPEDAEDLALGFFARLLERGDFLTADQEKGKLRFPARGRQEFHGAGLAAAHGGKTGRQGGSVVT